MLLGGGLCKKINVLDLSTNQRYPNKMPIMNMISWMRNTINKLYNAVSVPLVATRDVFAERLQSISETNSFLYNKMMYSIGYGGERLKDIVRKKAEEKEQETTEQTRQEQDNINLTPQKYDRVLKRSLHKVCDTWNTKHRH